MSLPTLAINFIACCCVIACMRNIRVLAKRKRDLKMVEGRMAGNEKARHLKNTIIPTTQINFYSKDYPRPSPG